MKRLLMIVLSLFLVLVFSGVNQSVHAEDAESPQSESEESNYDRIYGSNRYITCVETAKELYKLNNNEPFEYAVIASGEEFADALGGSYLACLRNAPIFIIKDSKSDYICDAIRSYVREGAKIYVLGGTGAVSDEAVESLRDTYQIERLSGKNRYVTNLSILDEADVYDEDIIVSTGKNFADSLSASSAGLPILLTGSSLTQDQRAFLSYANTDTFYIIGGTAAVSEAVEEELKEYGKVVRLSGKNRFETSVLIAETFSENAGEAVLAYSQNFPDGLCGGPLAYKVGAPIILTKTGSEQKAAEYIQTNDIYTGYILGGDSLIDGDTAKEVFPVNRAYAVLTEDKDLIYFRSMETYSTGEERDVTDLAGNTYHGLVFADVESDTKPEGFDELFEEHRSEIERIFVAEGQTVSFRWLPGFYSMSALKHFDSKGMNTSRVTDMSRLFSNSDPSDHFDITYFNTSNVVDMSGMFKDCGLTSVDLSHMNTSRVKSMASMFEGCRNLDEVDVSGFDTSSITDMSGMFKDCVLLNELDVSHFDTSNVETMASMFSGCTGLSAPDLSHFNTKNVKDMSSMFADCHTFKTIDVSSFDTSNVTSMYHMFFACRGLQNLDLHTFDTSKVEDMNGMFSQCLDLESLDISGFDTSAVTNTMDLFYSCTSLNRLVLGEKFDRWPEDTRFFDRSEYSWRHNDLSLTAEELRSAYPEHRAEWKGVWKNIPYNYAILEEDGDMVFFTGKESYANASTGTFTGANDETYTGRIFSGYEFDKFIPWLDYMSEIRTVSVGDGYTVWPETTSNWFFGAVNLREFYSQGFDTSAVKDMSRMFAGCSGLVTADLSYIDTSSVASMKDMFKDCSVLRRVVLENSFVKWIDTAYLGGGSNYKWTDGTETKTSSELYMSTAENRSGTWERVLEVLAVLTDEGELVFLQSFESSRNDVTGTAQSFDGKSFSGRIFNDIEGRNAPPWKKYKDSIRKVSVAESSVVRPKNMESWFSSAVNLSSFDGTGFDTSGVINMASLFSGCTSLTKLDLSGFDTSGVFDMRYMFANCTSLTELDLSGFDTSKVRDMDAMFGGCNSLEIVTLGSGFTKWINNACLGDDRLTLWKNGDNCQTSGTLYEDYPNNSSEWTGTWTRRGDTYAVLTEEGDLLFFTSREKYTNAEQGTFTGDNGDSFTGRVFVVRDAEPVAWTDYRELIKTASVADGYTVVTDSMKLWFWYAENLETFDGDGFLSKEIRDMGGMFSSCYSLTSADLHSFDTSNVTNMNGLFSGCQKLISLDLSSFDTSNVTGMNSMFGGCEELESIDVSHFDTSKVKDLSSMFSFCFKLKELDVRNFDTSNAIYMNSIFHGCKALEHIDVSSFNTSNATAMFNMFEDCSSLKSLDVSNFDTSMVTNANGMFYGCTSLESLDLSSFDTRNMKMMDNLVRDCTSLKELDLSSFVTYSDTTMTYMFEDCPALKTVNIGPGMVYWDVNSELGGEETYVWQKGDLVKTSKELQEGFIDHAAEWAGVWTRIEP
ncbi:MAG: BspA family leucine-rich repeat surface protein [Erysipelotrichaceae bacterium]|nr:BspA family leucine-rich repeat surface protein [Erysipelotrichaceae bacterium]